MEEDAGSKDARSWRRPQASRPAGPPQLLPMHKAEAKAIPRSSARGEPAWKDKDNWRSKAAPVSQHVSDAQRGRNGAAQQPQLSSSPGNHGPSHLSVSGLPSHSTRAPGTNHQNPWANGVGVIGSGRPNSTLKPSSIGSAHLGRAAGELSTSPPQQQHLQSSRSPPFQSGPWTVTQPIPGPATKLHSLQIGGFQPLDAKFSSTTDGSRALTEKECNDNWMLTPTSSLPSLPGTPNRARGHSVDGHALSAREESRDRTQAVDANALHRRREHESRVYGVGGAGGTSMRGPVNQLQATHQAPRTPSPSVGSIFASTTNAAPASSLLGRGLGGPIHSSPKRSPLAMANRSSPYRAGAYASPALVQVQTAVASHAPEPGRSASPKVSERAIPSAARLSSLDAQQLETDGRYVPTAGLSSLRSPGGASRRDSMNSVTSSVAGGYSLSRSRRSSQVMIPTSPTGAAKRAGVYRPPHLRNRGSASGLRPSVAHYDRVRAPNLRGQSRSRESSVSLSRGGSRPPSSLALYRTDTIPEHGTPDSSSLNHHGRLQSMTSVAGSMLEDRDRLVNMPQVGVPFVPAALPTHVSEEDGGKADGVARNTRQVFDGASLVAKLEEQSRIDEERIRKTVRQDLFSNSGKSGGEADDDGAAICDDHGDEDTNDFHESNSQDSFDLSVDDLMHYGGSDSHPLSRHASALDGRPPGDVFEIGDRLGPGLQHEGQTIRIAETTVGFVDQNADLTGSQLEVVRKLGEGSYAIVYLVREVMPEEPALTDADGAFHIVEDETTTAATDRFSAGTLRQPSSLARSHGVDVSYEAAQALIGADGDADETMVGTFQDLLSSTLKANAAAGHESAAYTSPSLEQRRRKDVQRHTLDPRAPPREFALKCLCKRDLPEEMLEVQRLEATIHQSIPAHPNIVTLYRTYETQDWLFLILEYCPGQDLYYWLEQAQDTEDAAVARQGQADGGGDDAVQGRRYSRDSVSPKPEEGDTTLDEFSSSLDATPPSPSLLASTAGNTLLSRRRVRLIARMFRQICDAVQFCHDRGVSHRDIKPENFIVEDRRHVSDDSSGSFAAPDQSTSTVGGGSMRDAESRVIVKMTDFGLATANERCDDFDCGSKPYMAYECHNNVSADYDPKQADVWSLGVVLLNLLFHRSPFTEPSSECPSFSAYCYDPIGFLMDSFDGLTEKVASFLAENVFCSLGEGMGSQKRISAGEFSRWAFGLVEHLDLNGPGPGRISRGASMYATTPLVHSRTASLSTLPSLLGSPKARSRSIARDQSFELPIEMNPDATFRSTFFDGRQNSLSPAPGLFTPDVLPSPRFTPSPRPQERNPFDAQYERASPLPAGPTSEQACTGAPVHGSNLRQEIQVESQPEPGSLSAKAVLDEALQDSLDSAEVDAMLQCETATPKGILEPLHTAMPDPEATTVLAIPAEPRQEQSAALEACREAKEKSRDRETRDRDEPRQEEGQQESEPSRGPQETGRDEVDGDDDVGELPSPDDGDKAPSIAVSNHSKRRKRGARKGRTLAKQLKRSRSVENLSQPPISDPSTQAREREATIKELALASETLARQMSKMHSRQAESEDAASFEIPTVSLSPPTAAAAAKYNLQALSSQAQKPNDPLAPQRSFSPVQDTSSLRRGLAQRSEASNEAGPSGSQASRSSFDRSSTIDTTSSLSSNWSSAAQRRERINERKFLSGMLLQDSGRSKPMSWRDRNQSTTTFSSIASTTTVSTLDSISSATSSVNSTASAPAALTKREAPLRSRSRVGGLLGASGLGTISEREKPPKKEVDASYLAAIFGGDEARIADKKRKEATTKAKEPGRIEGERQKGKLREQLHDLDKGSKKDSRVGQSSSTEMDPSASATATSPSSNSFVSRFRRPGSSSSTKSKEQQQQQQQQVSTLTKMSFDHGSVSGPSHTSASLVRDASGSTTSLATPNYDVTATVSRSASLVERDKAVRARELTSRLQERNAQQQQQAAGGTLRSPSSTSVRSLALGKSETNGTASNVVDGAAAPVFGETVAAAAPAPAPATKKRGMGKFFSGMRDSIMNR